MNGWTKGGGCGGSVRGWRERERVREWEWEREWESEREREREREKKNTSGLLQQLQWLPLTRCSSCVMTSTAWWSTVNFGCDLSVLRWIWHIRPSSLNASFMSFTRTLISCQFANFVFVLFFFYCCFCIRICICFVYGRVCVFSISTAPSSACVDLRI